MDSRGFAPLAAPSARVLVLGSLPGQESLRRQQYYAQPRNAFWAIMGELFGAGPALPYDARVARLRRARVAVWDVCQSAYRAGSLDASIRPGTVIANDFAAFFRRLPALELVCFNGQAAEQLYLRFVLPTLDEPMRQLPRRRLPSTSPAHASLPLEGKLRAWSELTRTLARPAPVRKRARAR
jgi:double-stranded uracil-DNA glycosylase